MSDYAHMALVVLAFIFVVFAIGDSLGIYELGMGPK